MMTAYQKTRDEKPAHSASRKDLGPNYERRSGIPLRLPPLWRLQFQMFNSTGGRVAIDDLIASRQRLLNVSDFTEGPADRYIPIQRHDLWRSSSIGQTVIPNAGKNQIANPSRAMCRHPNRGGRDYDLHGTTRGLNADITHRRRIKGRQGLHRGILIGVIEPTHSSCGAALGDYRHITLLNHRAIRGAHTFFIRKDECSERTVAANAQNVLPLFKRTAVDLLKFLLLIDGCATFPPNFLSRTAVPNC